MKVNIKRRPTRTRQTARKRLTKGVFRQFNRKSRAWQEDVVTAIANSISRGGKAFIDGHDRVIVSRVIVGKVIIIVIPAQEVRGWCGNEPRPLPPPPPCPDPSPCGNEPRPIPPPNPIPDDLCGLMPAALLDKAQRQTVGRYLSAVLKTHQDVLHLSTFGKGFHSIAIGNKASLHVMGNL